MLKPETEIKKLKALLDKFYNWHVWLSSKYGPLDFVEKNAIFQFYLRQDHGTLARILNMQEQEIAEAYARGCAKLKKDGQRLYESWLIHHVLKAPLYKQFLVKGQTVNYYNN